MKFLHSKASLLRNYFFGIGVYIFIGTYPAFAQTGELVPKNNFFFEHLILICSLITVCVFIFLFSRWDKDSKDEEGKGFVAYDYEVPDNLSPIEVSAIVYQEVRYNSIFAELVYLAHKGYIKIRQIDVPIEMYPKKKMRLIHGGSIGKDFELTLIKSPSGLKNQFQRDLVNQIFDYGIYENGVKVMHLSRIPNAFYYIAERVGVMASEGLLKKGYYKYLGKLRKNTVLGLVPNHLIAPISTFVGYIVFFIYVIEESFRIFYFLLGIVLTIIFFVYFSPAKTQKGIYAKESLLGLKKYMNIFEKDRIYFHNAPHKRPEEFEELLPYAMVLGVDHAWVREFEGIYSDPSKPGNIDLISFSKLLSTPVTL